MRRSTATTLLALAACAQPSSSTDKEPAQPAAKAPAAAPACRSLGDAEPLAAFSGSRCDWVLLGDPTGLRLRTLDVEGPSDAIGVMPEACLEHRCRFEGVRTELGPLVLAIQRSAHSEMPAGLHLGVPDGQRLRFVDLWAGAGEPVIGDATELGPAYMLAPFACDGALGLFVAGRLNAARDVEPPPELLRREGLLVFDDDRPAMRPVERAQCNRIALQLP